MSQTCNRVFTVSMGWMKHCAIVRAAVPAMMCRTCRAWYPVLRTCSSSAQLVLACCAVLWQTFVNCTHWQITLANHTRDHYYTCMHPVLKGEKQLIGTSFNRAGGALCLKGGQRVVQRCQRLQTCHVQLAQRPGRARLCVFVYRCICHALLWTPATCLVRARADCFHSWAFSEQEAEGCTRPMQSEYRASPLYCPFHLSATALSSVRNEPFQAYNVVTLSVSRVAPCVEIVVKILKTLQNNGRGVRVHSVCRSLSSSINI